jgi:hypothetical protein
MRQLRYPVRLSYCHSDPIGWPGGIHPVVAESVLVRHQLLIRNRGRKCAPNPCTTDRIIAGFESKMF